MALSGGLFVDAARGRAFGAMSLLLAVATACAFWLPAPEPRAEPHTLDAWRRLVGRPALWLFLGAAALGQAAGAGFDGCFSLHLQRLGFGGRFVGAAWAVGVTAEVALMAVA